jgi:5-formyltetrahydrofolate cyclo-ligase
MDKEALRERIWDDLEDSGEARFPFPPHGRIPNYAGADEAAGRLAGTEEWREATAIKANPDAPQRPVRRRALEAGKTVYMAVPRLADKRCFLELDPARIDDIDTATTISGSSELGEQVGPDAVTGVGLVVSGSVAVTAGGARVGKGEGFSDLEYAVLLELGLVDEATPVATSVHERQVVDDEVPVEAHDVPMDIVATPDRLIHTETAHARPSGIDWDALSRERREEIPVLDQFAPDKNDDG